MLSTRSFLCRLLFEVEHLPMLLRLECRDYPHPLASESNCDPQNSSLVGLPDVGSSIFAVNHLECDVEGVARYDLFSLCRSHIVLCNMANICAVPFEIQIVHGLSN